LIDFRRATPTTQIAVLAFGEITVVDQDSTTVRERMRDASQNRTFPSRLWARETHADRGSNRRRKKSAKRFLRTIFLSLKTSHLCCTVTRRLMWANVLIAYYRIMENIYFKDVIWHLCLDRIPSFKMGAGRDGERWASWTIPRRRQIPSIEVIALNGPRS